AGQPDRKLASVYPVGMLRLQQPHSRHPPRLRLHKPEQSWALQARRVAPAISPLHSSCAISALWISEPQRQENCCSSWKTCYRWRLMAILKKNAFSRRVPDLVTEELVAVLS